MKENIRVGFQSIESKENGFSFIEERMIWGTRTKREVKREKQNWK